MPLFKPKKRGLITRRDALVSGAAALAIYGALTEYVEGRPHGGVSAAPSYPVPPAAAAVGFTKNMLYSDFSNSSIIDLGQTNAPGFQWYITAADWPFGTSIGWPNVNPAWITQNSDSITFAPPNLGMDNVGGPQLPLIMSAAYKSTAPYYTGFVMPPNFYAEIECGYTAPAAAGSPCPSFWSQTLDVWANLNSDPSIECDFFEYAYPSGTYDLNFDTIYWPPGYATVNHQQTMPGGLIIGAQNTYAMRQQTAAYGGGTGYVDYYVNRNLISAASNTYTATGPASPGFAGGNAPGQMNWLDVKDNVLLIQAGNSSQIQVWNVQVWGPP